MKTNKETKRYGCIYKITNLINGKIYIGQHKYNKDKYYMGSGIILKQAFDKYGKENFKIEILIEVDSVKELNAMEKKYIKEYNCCNHSIGYNITSGGNNYPITEEGRKQLSLKLKGRKCTWITTETFTPETRKRISEATKGGKTYTKNVRQAISKRLKDSCYINKNGIEKRIRPEELESYLKEGWNEGLSQKTKDSIGKGNKDRKWMTNGIDYQIVSKKDQEEYLNKGWYFTTPFKLGLLKYMYKENFFEIVKKEDFENRLKEGWLFGKGSNSSNIIGNRWMNDGINVKMVHKEKINEFLSKGWKFGALNKCKKKENINEY